MKQKNNEHKNNIGLIPKLAKKLGEHSVNQTCIWWSHQPKVPKQMQNEKK